MRSGQVRSGQVSSSQVRSGQVRSDQVRSDQISSGQVRSDRVTRFLWFLERAARRKFCFCNPSARSAEKNFAFATLARAAWRKILQRQTGSPVFSGIWRAQRGEKFAFATLARAARRKILQRQTRSPVFSGIWKCWGNTGSALMEKNTKVERFICRKHNGRAKTSLQKAFFGIFFATPRLPSLHFFFT